MFLRLKTCKWLHLKIRLKYKIQKQVEAEVVPSSSLVEVEVEGVRVGVGLTFSVGWVGGWLECWRVKLISSQVVVEVEV